MTLDELARADRDKVEMEKVRKTARARADKKAQKNRKKNAGKRRE